MEMILFPLLAPLNAALLLKARKEHSLVRAELQCILGMNVAEPDRKAKLSVLNSFKDEHTAQEEELLPLGDIWFPPRENERLGQEMKELFLMARSIATSGAEAPPSFSPSHARLRASGALPLLSTSTSYLAH
jgi:hypothetical protein